MGTGSVFNAAVADTEPDGWGKRVIQRDHAKRRQDARRRGEEVDARALNGLDYLLAVDDVSRVGALRLVDEQGVAQRATEDGRRTTPPLIELGHLLAASRAVETNTETAADLAYLRGRGTSLGGLRPKCTVLDDEGRLSIGKFPSVADERSVTRGEVLAMRLARRAGIDAADARLTHRRNLDDPTTVFDTMETPGARLRIGLAHGLIRDFSSRGEAQNQIAPDRAQRSRLDYLGPGDWHGALRVDARTWYSGTPETDRFQRDEPGHALLVTLEPGPEPVVSPIRTGRFQWLMRDWAISDAACFAAECDRFLAARNSGVAVSRASGVSFCLVRLLDQMGTRNVTGWLRMKWRI